MTASCCCSVNEGACSAFSQGSKQTVQSITAFKTLPAFQGDRLTTTLSPQSSPHTLELLKVTLLPTQLLSGERLEKNNLS